MAASNASSFLVSLLISLLLFASMQLFRSQLASSQPMTIAGGFIGSMVFVSLLTALSNCEMNMFGPTYQARVFPEVFICLFVSMICCACVHRVCVTTCLIFSLIALFYINRISASTYGSSSVPATGYATQNFSAKKKQK
ncbi:unnamed protein product [Rotaria magnacalcarata]|uniref:Dolichyl-diphosphooligosaccharide--protein glycosyltransferase subunit KCP2 n=2 Tax=Rotaria magnacalcarata TaxID=392030 RepID=A0A814USF0_9BILA|nr:unnamed protein product [Rotaria magnacalcarata]CAF1565013.1 unnamed protein product [Rotaria magnacalcarata]CAF2121062.1 unnamed protein product [Rotaria magnacalcarata]CAF2187074.1 unnamed protein product [Rotaria magnacalcarata]CAF2243549.1 unnamed protein product [Rotaria magnacalcarata]